MLNKMINLDLSGKKILLVLLLLLVTVGVFGTTYYVSVDGDDQNPGTQEEPFQHIQYAIDLAVDRDAIIVESGTYEENLAIIDLDELSIKGREATIQGVDENRANVVYISESNNINISGFSITGATSGSALVLDHGSDDCTFKDLIFHNNNGMINIGISLYCGDNHFYNILLRNNSTNFSFYSQASITEHNYFDNITVLDDIGHAFWGLNYGGAYGGDITVRNSIFCNSSFINEDGFSSITVEYSNIECGYEGEGNIATDPLLDANYQPMWNETVKSPCIDTGDPESGLDADDTRADMGAVPTVEHDYEEIDLSGWTWLCFPVLDTDYQYGDIVRDMLADIINVEFGLNSDLDHAEWLPFNTDSEYKEFIQWYNNAWSNLTHEFTSVQGYKFQMQDGVETNLEMSGWLASPEETIFPYLEANCEQWMGYFLEETLECNDAIGNVYWNKVASIEAQDWYYNVEAGIASSSIRPFEYGKMYIVTFNERIDNFRWNTNIGTEPVDPFVRQKPEYFEYEEKANYEVIDVLDIPEDVLEIGVYQDDRCVGAVVADEDAEQILVYSDRMNRDETVFTFQLVYGRSGAVELSNYTVYDKKVGEYVKGNIVAGKQKYSAIRFESGEPTDPPQVMQLLGNFPNPFTGETTISFSLTTNLHEKARIEIFNIKGQKVENLQITNSANQQIIWNANNFANGVYLYKLVVDGIAVDTKKMILLK